MEVLTPWVNQGLLIKHLGSIFKGEETHVNTKSQSNVKSPSGTFLELDAWIPNLDIAFEFQDDYHYITTWYTTMDKEKINFKDSNKTTTVRKNEITLIIVPCWWDGTRESLASTILSQRPDLQKWCEIECDPVPLNPPLGYFTPKDIPNVGELMLASFPESNSFKITAFNNSWWLGEKYDGIRCCWNSERQKIYTRSGRALNLGTNITAVLPTIFVDGEIWFGRGKFSLTHMLLIGAKEFIYWHTLRLITFDVPSADLHATPFEERYSLLLSHTSSTNPLLVIANRVLCDSREHLNKMAQGVIDEGGEGVIMRIVGSHYLPGRNPALVKLKTVFQDMEGIVVGIDDNNSVVLKLPDGRILTVTSQNVLIGPLNAGDIVTFSYERHAKKINMVLNPTIVKIRTDVSWEDVVENSAREARYLSEYSRMGEKVSGKSKGEWTTKMLRSYMERIARRKGLDPLLPATWLQIIPKFKRGATGKQLKILQRLFPKLDFTTQFRGVDIESRRNFFEDYAKEYQFDPQNPENWYTQPRKRIAKFQGASSVIEYHKGSVSKALLSVFPNIGLDKNRLWDRMQWEDPKNRRRFFENYARERGFSPFVPENWYKETFRNILSAKGISRVIFYHRSSVSQALVDLFPEIGLKKLKFSSNASSSSLAHEPHPLRRLMYWDRRSWSDVGLKRKFFEDYAKRHAFDPLVADNWYKQPRERILSAKGAYGVMYFHNKSIQSALVYLFPEVNFEESKFSLLYEWEDKAKRRKFFEKFAKQNDFDPLTAEEWYMQSREKITATEGALGIASYYHKNLARALVDLFPDVNFNRAKIFSMVDKAEQRKFFEKYAVDHGFDPLNPNNWYPTRRNRILSVRGAFAIMTYHNQSVSQALQALFPELDWQPDKFLQLRRHK